MVDVIPGTRGLGFIKERMGPEGVGGDCERGFLLHQLVY